MGDAGTRLAGASYLPLAGLAALVGALAFLDDLIEARRLALADLLLAALIAAAAFASLVALRRRHEEIRGHLERTRNVGAQALAAAVAARDHYTASHCDAVVELAVRVGRRLGLDEQALGRLELAARLHDVGKLSVPDSILLKPGPLDEREWELMRRHPIWGYEVLSKVSGLEEVAKIVHAEHERWDGEGYPIGLRGREIPIEARIVFACDAFHAMTSDRPYRDALPVDVAVREMLGGAGTQFDPSVVEALLAVLKITIPGDRVVLGLRDRRAAHVNGARTRSRRKRKRERSIA